MSLIDIIDTEHALDDQDDDDESPILLQHSPCYTNDDAIELFLTKQDIFSIISLNCQSLPAKFDQLKIYIAQFDYPFSIIAVQETWLTINHDVSLFQLDGYTFIHKPSTCSRHGGVGIYLRSDFNFQILPVSGNNEVWDGLCVEIKVDSGNRSHKVIICNIYRPPRELVEYYSIFVDDIEHILSTTLRPYKNVLLTGDFNIDLLKIKESPHINNFFEMIISSGYLPKITLPTRITDHSKTLIDNCFVKLSVNLSNTTSGILKYNISDHQPYFVILDYLKLDKSKDRYVKVFLNSPKAKEKFQNDLAKNCIIEKFDQNIDSNPNDNYAILNDILTSALDKHLPVKYVRYDKYKHKKSKWITKGIIMSIKFRDKLYNKLRSTPVNSPDYVKYKVNLQTYNRILRQNIRIAKKNYYYACFSKFKNDIKSTWSTIKEIIGNSKVANTLPDYFLIDDQPESDPVSIVNKFNSYFTQIGPKLAYSILSPPNKSFKDYLKKPVNTNFSFKPVNTNTVIKIIDSLKPKSSCGCDRFSNKLLKTTKNEIVHVLTLIINQSLSTGIFPDRLKIAKVLPLYKKKENYLFDNYRPVSLLPSISKVLERIVHMQLLEHFDSLNIFYENQYGFRSKHSTELAAVELLDRIVSQMDNNDTPINIYLDLSKAFDTLDHDILLYKLQYYGVRGNALLLLRSYLENRQQFVEYGNIESDYLPLSTGVPQGSILGPLLFIIYINDINMATSTFKATIYADDTALSATLSAFSVSELSVEEKINKELDKVNDWFKLNKLSLNIAKTKAMLFHTPQKRVIPPNIMINDTNIEFVNNFNYLGIIFDSNLSWNYHIDMVSRKIARTVGVMARLKNFLPAKVLLTLYNSLILPYLNYGLVVWGEKCLKLFTIQKRAVRLILNAKYNSHTNPIFKELKLLKICDLYSSQEFRFVFKLEKRLLPKYFLNKSYLRHSDRHDYDTRNAQNFELLRSRHHFTRNSICYRVPEIMNDGSSDILDKIGTLSLSEYMKYIKMSFINSY